MPIEDEGPHAGLARPAGVAGRRRAGGRHGGGRRAGDAAGERRWGGAVGVRGEDAEQEHIFRLCLDVIFKISKLSCGTCTYIK